MANTDIFPKNIGQTLPPVTLSVAEDTITYKTGYDAIIVGQGLGSVASGGLFRTKTVGRKIQLIGDAAWAIADATGALGTKTLVPANTPYIVELVKETEVRFVMGQAGAVSLRQEVVG